MYQRLRRAPRGSKGLQGIGTPRGWYSSGVPRGSPAVAAGLDAAGRCGPCPCADWPALGGSSELARPACWAAATVVALAALCAMFVNLSGCAVPVGLPAGLGMGLPAALRAGCALPPPPDIVPLLQVHPPLFMRTAKVQSDAQPLPRGGQGRGEPLVGLLWDQSECHCRASRTMALLSLARHVCFLQI